ncbi:MAG: DUF1801 domain-containing protein [Bermanella sp.]
MKKNNLSAISFDETVFNSEPVQQKFSAYPQEMQQRLLFLRQLILDCTDKNIEETLKWGEPSYLCAQGSTIRIDYKEKFPHQYAMYFNCKSKLIDTFKEIYADEFIFEGNRAIIFKADQNINISALKNCIALALNYHQVKHLPLLGASLL